MALGIVGDGVVIPLELFRERKADGMLGAERAKVRSTLVAFEAYRSACPTARREAQGESWDASPLKPEELQALRTMLVQFEALQTGCPAARRIKETGSY